MLIDSHIMLVTSRAASKGSRRSNERLVAGYDVDIKKNVDIKSDQLEILVKNCTVTH
jgi:hypothetical protein